MINKIREKSPLQLFQAVLRTLHIRFVDFGILYFMSFDQLPNPDERSRFNGRIRLAGAEDIPALLEVRNKEAMFRQRFAEGDFCLLAENEQGRVVGFEWFSIKPQHFETKYRFKINIPKDTVYVYDALILPEYRIRGIWPLFKSNLHQFMTDHQRLRIMTFIEQDNALSFKTHFRYGFRIYRRCKVLRLPFFSLTHRRRLEHSVELMKKLALG